MRNLPPGPLIKQTIIDIEAIFQGTPYWLCFGALWGLIRNRGTITDGDFDICVNYGVDWKLISDRAAKRRYQTKKVMVSDQIKSSALFMGLYRDEMYICVSFWYPFQEYYFWCHDQNNEILDGVGIPTTGYYFKGCPRHFIDSNSKFIKAEWPGIDQRTTIRVPLFAGTILDLCYPGWPYLKQRYVPSNYRVDESQCVSVNNPTYNKGVDERAFSMIRVHVNSMSEFKDTVKINGQIEENKNAWMEALRKRKY